MESGDAERPEVQPEGVPGPPPPPPGWPPPPSLGPPGWPSPPPPQAYPAWPPPGWGAVPPPTSWGPPVAVPGWNSARPAPAAGYGRFRPLGVGELLDASFALYRRNLLLLVAITAVVQVPFAVLNLVIFQLLGVGADLDAAGSRSGLFGSPANPGASLTPAQVTAAKSLFIYVGIVVALQMFVVLPLSLAAMSRAVSDRYLDRPASLGSSYAAAVRRGGALLGAILLLLLLVAGLSAAALAGIGVAAVAGPIGIVPAIALGIGWLLALPLVAVRSTLFAQAVVVEGAGSLTGLRRSWRLTRGFFWRTCAIVLVVLLLQQVVGGILAIPVALLASGAGPGTQQLISQAVGAVTSVFVSPLSLIALTLVYYDLRIRKEAFDIEMLAASL